MAKPKKKPVPKPPRPGKVMPSQPKKRNPNPPNYLRGSHLEGEKYTAYSNYDQGRPDFGKGSGPGEPYHEVTRTVQKPLPGPPAPKSPRWAPGRSPVKPKPRPTGNLWNDAKQRAIRKRLETF